jgi:formylglycine-generating enzyme required for sulfatase activity
MKHKAPATLAALLFLLATASCSRAGAVPRCTQIGQTWSSPVDGAVLVCVPAGDFIMGASPNDPNAKGVEQPAHNVFVDAFWIDQTEVTNAQFALCVSEGVCTRSQDPGATGVASKTRSNYFYDEAFANYPVLVYRSVEAEEFCAWAGRRLPTEAEWEKSARGTDGRIYPWGDQPPACDLVNGWSCYTDTIQVNSLPQGKSPYGAADMSGNVWEWVADTFDPEYYANTPNDNPTDPAENGYQTRRGGGWSSLLADLRSSRRASGKPLHYFDGQMGFRCAVDGG